MSPHYSPKKLTQKEWRVIEEVLLEEMEKQEWYGVAVVGGVEMFLSLQ